ncbi:MAG: 30S ribosomal protein S5 [Candidatus Aenigmarchaeota archaeon]|nr:30S ribosomal protein S5 [Candidatus Aenigmarchaeota archaeon]
MKEWKPRTALGKKVMSGEISSIDQIFAAGIKIKEPDIVDKLLPNLTSVVMHIGGSPGKGGGIRRTPTRRTARMHRSGRRYKISAMVIVGCNGYVGVGKSQSNEHSVAIDKATQAAKLNIIPVRKGCGSWECVCGGAHSISMIAEGSSGSVTVRLIPAPKGIGLCIGDEAKKILRIAGISDIWSKCFGKSRTRVNYILAVIAAMKNLNKQRTKDVAEELAEEKTIGEEVEQP